MVISGSIHATDKAHVSFFTGGPVETGSAQFIDASHQTGFSGYVVSDTTTIPTDQTFWQGQILGRGDLTLTLADWTYAWGRQLDATTYTDGTWGYLWVTPIWINYSVWHQDYDTSQFSLVGYRYRDPISDNVGKFYAPMVVPSPPGHYELRWRFQKDSSSYAKEIDVPFVSLSRGVDSMPDYPPAPPRSDHSCGILEVIGVDPGVDIIGLFSTTEELSATPSDM
jgi:hypothetical protein